MSKVRLRRSARGGADEDATETDGESTQPEGTGEQSRSMMNSYRPNADSTQQAGFSFEKIKKSNPVQLRAQDEEIYELPDSPLEIEFIDTGVEEEMLPLPSLEDLLDLFDEVSKDLILP